MLPNPYLVFVGDKNEVFVAYKNEVFVGYKNEVGVLGGYFSLHHDLPSVLHVDALLGSHHAATAEVEVNVAAILAGRCIALNTLDGCRIAAGVFLNSPILEYKLN